MGIVGTGYCKHCDEIVNVVSEDHGIGRYELLGKIYLDVHYVYVCSECEEEMEDGVDFY